MAQTRNYLNHLLQSTGITPACSMEERAAADEIAKTFTRHGLTPEIQEFSASGSSKIIVAALGVLVFIGAVLAGLGGAAGIIGLLLVVVSCALLTLDRLGRAVLPSAGAGGLSQNVIAHHEACGPMASPRNRPVVVVAHYDSPRADVFSQMPYATYRPLIARLMPIAMVAPAVFMVVRILPLPATAKLIFWILAILASAAPLARAIATILNRLALPYTSGAVCNKSSVAALLGIMNEVAPYRGEQEFPDDTPFETYIAEQRRDAEQQLLAEKPAGVPAHDDGAPLPVESPEHMDETGVELGGESAATGVFAQPSDLDGIVPPGAVSSISRTTDDASDTGCDQDGATQTLSPIDHIDTDGLAAASDEVQIPVEESPSDQDGVARRSNAEQERPPEPEAADADEGEPAPPAVERARGARTEHGWRFGPALVRSLGMVSESCELVYEDDGTDGGAPSDECPLASSESADAGGRSADQCDVADDTGSGNGGLADRFEDDCDGGPANGTDVDRGGLCGKVFDDEPDERARRAGSGKVGLAETLSEVGAGAARIFDATIRRGRDLISGSGDGVVSPAQTPRGARDPSDGEPGDHCAPDDQFDVRDAAPAARPADQSAGQIGGSRMGASGAQGVSRDDTPREKPTTTASPSNDAAEPAGDLGATVAQEPFAGAPQPSTPNVSAAPAPAQPSPVARPDQPPTASRAVSALDTVDSLMAQISRETARSSSRSRRVPAVPLVTGDASAVTPPAPGWDLPRMDPPTVAPLGPAVPAVIGQTSSTNRSSLFDLPDPAVHSADPFSPESVDLSSASTPRSVPFADAIPERFEAPVAEAGVFEVISAARVDGPLAEDDDDGRGRKRGLGRFFGRKRREHESMSEWLGVEEDFNAKEFGRDVGSWENFGDGDEGWKGGAAGESDTAPEEMRNAITSLGDDELLGHDIWFVTTGASEYGNAGMKAFLDEHREKLRGVFLINLECVGAGELAMVATEGEERALKGDKRIMSLVRKVSAAFHQEFATVDMPYLDTDAHAAMGMSLRALTIAGVDGPRLACSHSEDDLPYNVDVDNVALVSDVVTEVIRRS